MMTQQVNNYQEKVLNAVNGWLMLLLDILLFAGSIALLVYAFTAAEPSFLLVPAVVLFIIACILPNGLKVLRPNEALVLTLFGRYKGTLKKDGFFFVNPFCSAVSPTNASPAFVAPGRPAVTAKKISLKTMTLKNEKQKVNDLLGNPIEIGINVIWKITDTAKAVFGVDNYEEYLSIQADAVLRNVVRLYPYDLSEQGDEKSLRGSSQEIAESLKDELQKKSDIAGLEILEVRITHLAYAQEIAAAMLQRQQAVAVIEARQKIVEGAVGMVELALNRLSEKRVCDLDDERKAQMVSNLLVVLCANRETQPIVNSGTLY